MTTFWIAAAGLMALAAWMLRPAAGGATSSRAGASTLAILKAELARLDPSDHLARAEIERRVLDEASEAAARVVPGNPRRTWALSAAGAALLAIALYATLGNPAGLAPPPPAADDVSMADVNKMVQGLADRLANDPKAANDPTAWTMLARSYAAMQRFPDASRAYARALALSPDDPQLLADQADVLAMLQGGRAAGEPTKLIERALSLDPKNLKALALAGSAASERGDLAAAAMWWRKARALAPAGSDFAAGLDRSLAELGAQGGAPGTSGATASPAGTANSGATATLAGTADSGATATSAGTANSGGTATSAGTANSGGTATLAGTANAAGTGNSTETSNSAGTSTATGAATAIPTATNTIAAATSGSATALARIEGTVTLSPALAARIQPTDTVFIVARAINGPRMPLAVVRRVAGDLPISYTLDDSLSMSPELKLSAFPRVQVTARISRSGNPMPHAGDLQGTVEADSTRGGKVDIVIGTVQP